METPDKKELIEEISALFHAHEEVYEQGAWENFVKEKKKKRVLLPWIGIAAALLLLCSVLPFIWRKDLPQDREVVKATSKSPAEALPKTAVPGPADPGTGRATQKSGVRGSGTTLEPGQAFAKNKKESVTGTGEVKENSRPAVIAKPDFETSLKTASGTVKPANDKIVPEGKVVEAMTGTTPLPGKNTDAQKAIVQTINKQPAAEEKQQKKEKDFLDFLKAESRKKELAALKEKEKAKEAKWSFGLDVSPGLMQSKLSMGGGFSTELKLAGKFSLSSGISYTALNAGSIQSGNQSFNSSDSPSPGSAAYSLTSSSTTIKRKLVSIDARIRAIDIPVSLVYHLNKKMYVSAGLSYFGVFNEERNTNYVTETIQNKTYQDLSTGQIRTAEQVVTGESKSVTDTAPLKGNSYIGFFNFSTGRKQQISPKNYLILEPFIKVPIGKLSKDELRLTNGGLRLKLTF